MNNQDLTKGTIDEQLAMVAEFIKDLRKTDLSLQQECLVNLIEKYNNLAILNTK